MSFRCMRFLIEKLGIYSFFCKVSFFNFGFSRERFTKKTCFKVHKTQEDDFHKKSLFY